MFDRVFVINLPHRTDRRREMQRELKRVGIDAEFFPAFKFDDAKPFHTAGIRGCYMSHLAALKLASGSANVAIFEDDLNFIREFKSRTSVFARLPEKWALFYGGHNFAPLNKDGQSFRRVSPQEELTGAHFYVVNGFAIPLLLDALETFLTRERDHPLGGPMPIDGALNIFRRQNPNLTAFAADPALGYQRASKSDCDTGPRLDNNPLFALALKPLRKIKNLVRHG